MSCPFYFSLSFYPHSQMVKIKLQITQPERKPGRTDLSRIELSEVRKGVDVTRRNCHDGRRQVYFAGARCKAFFSEKYDITRHPRYKYLSDADKKNYFDVDRYLTALRWKRQRVVSREETFDLYDIDLSDEDMAAEDE